MNFIKFHGPYKHEVSKLNNKKGFTLLEVVAVLSILGVLAAVAFARGNSNEYDVVVQQNIIEAHLRYAQLKAMSTGLPWYISFKAGSYQLHKGGSAPSLQLFPGQEKTTAFLTSGVSFSPAGAIVCFNSWGQPATDSAGDALQSKSRTLILKKGSNTRTIRIVDNTGVIQ